MTEFVSELLGKPLITRGGERIGYVKNVQTDRAVRRIRNLECCDEEEEEFLLPLSATEAGKDAVVVRSPAARPCKNCISAPLGMTVYSADGEELGRLADLALEEGGISRLLLSGGQSIAAERLLSVTDAAIVDLSENFVPKGTGTRTARRTPAAPRPRAPRAKSPAEGRPSEENAAAAEISATAGTAESAAAEPIAEIPAAAPRTDTEQTAEEPVMESAEAAQMYAGAEAATMREAAAAGSDAAERETAFTGAAQPARSARRAGSSLLTGKILPKDLKDVRGNVLARAGTVVSREVIRRAMEHGKLFELTLLCANDFTKFVF